MDEMKRTDRREGRASARSAGGRLPASEVSAFCEGLSAMLAAGIQTDEALALMAESGAGTPLADACGQLYGSVAAGSSLSAAMERAGGFPSHAVSMIRLGERAGRTERVLASLASYYDEEARVLAKIRTAVGYPAALLCVMSVVLLFTVVVILPVFMGVYEDMAGSLTSGTSLFVGASIAVGWAALVICLVAAGGAVAAVVASRTPAGQERLVRLMERAPLTRDAMRQLAVSRFAASLSTCLAAGSNVDVAMEEALATVEHGQLRESLVPALEAMTDAGRGAGLAEAIAQTDVLDPTSARMLAIGMRAGSADAVLERLSQSFFEEAADQVDRTVDAIEPALAAFLTLAVGCTLVSVMLPLIGIMGSVG